MQLERHQFSVVFAILAMCTTSAHAQRSPETRGEDLVSRHCAMCHANGRSGTSPDSKAPPFRTLGAARAAGIAAGAARKRPVIRPSRDARVCISATGCRCNSSLSAINSAMRRCGRVLTFRTSRSHHAGSPYHQLGGAGAKRLVERRCGRAMHSSLGTGTLARNTFASTMRPLSESNLGRELDFGHRLAAKSRSGIFGYRA